MNSSMITLMSGKSDLIVEASSPNGPKTKMNVSEILRLILEKQVALENCIIKLSETSASSSSTASASASAGSSDHQMCTTQVLPPDPNLPTYGFAAPRPSS